MMQKRQFITDDTGKPVAVILPLEDYNRVRSILEAETETDKLQLMQEAAKDEAFLADLEQVSKDFEHVDAEWWEPS